MDDNEGNTNADWTPEAGSARPASASAEPESPEAQPSGTERPSQSVNHLCIPPHGWRNRRPPDRKDRE